MEERYPSPDGRYVLRLGCYEMKMSHWVCWPQLIVAESGRVLYEGGDMEDAGSISWSEDSRTLRFFLRTYPGREPGRWVTLQLDGEEATVL